MCIVLILEQIRFMRVHCFCCISFIFQIFAPIFGGRVGIPIYNFGIAHLFAKDSKKNQPAPIFGVLELYAQIWHCFRTLKIGDASIFLIFSGNKGHLPQLYIKKLARRQNMGAQLPLEKFWTQNRAGAAHTNFGVLAPAQFWLQNTFYWELGPHISLAIVPGGP